MGSTRALVPVRPRVDSPVATGAHPPLAVPGASSRSSSVGRTTPTLLLEVARTHVVHDQRPPVRRRTGYANSILLR
jgi:hypothetical protein